MAGFQSCCTQVDGRLVSGSIPGWLPLSLRFPSPRVGSPNRPVSARITRAGFQSQVGPRDGRLDRSGSACIAVSEPHARCYSESADYDTDAGRSLAVRRTVRRPRRRRPTTTIYGNRCRTARLGAARLGAAPCAYNCIRFARGPTVTDSPSRDRPKFGFGYDRNQK